MAAAWGATVADTTGVGYEVQAAPAAPPATDEAVGVRRAKPLGFIFWLAVGFLAVLTLSAIFAEALPLKDPAQTFAGNNRAGPSASFWFGNDGAGRDIFSRVIYGAQVSLIVASVGATLALMVGGMIAGGALVDGADMTQRLWLVSPVNTALEAAPRFFGDRSTELADVSTVLVVSAIVAWTAVGAAVVAWRYRKLAAI